MVHGQSLTSDRRTRCERSSAWPLRVIHEALTIGARGMGVVPARFVLLWPGSLLCGLVLGPCAQADGELKVQLSAHYVGAIGLYAATLKRRFADVGRDGGLDVDLVEVGDEIDPIAEQWLGLRVLAATAACEWSRRMPLVALGARYRQLPPDFASLRWSGVTAPRHIMGNSVVARDPTRADPDFAGHLHEQLAA